MPDNNITIGIDCDEVLAKFKDFALNIIETYLNKKIDVNSLNNWDLFSFLSMEESEKVWKIINSSHNIQHLNIFEGVKEAIEEIKSLAEIYIITAPLKDYQYNFINYRNMWLKNNLDINPENVIYTKAKYMVSVDVFIDDHPLNMQKWLDRNKGYGFLWEYPFTNFYDCGRAHVTNNWNDVIKYLKILKNKK